MIYIDISGKKNININKYRTISTEYAFYERLSHDYKEGIELQKRRFNTEEDYLNAYKYLEDLSERLSVIMKKIWNDVCGVDLTLDQSEYLFRKNMLLNLFLCYDHYLALRNIIDEHHDAVTVGIEPEFYDGNGFDTYSSYEFHTKLYTFFCEKMGIRVLEYFNVSAKKEHKEYLANILRYPRFYPTYFKKIVRVIKRKTKINNKETTECCDTGIFNVEKIETLMLREGFPEPVTSEITNSSNGKSARLSESQINSMFSDIPYIEKADYFFRDCIIFNSFLPQNEFEELLVSLLSRLLPTGIVENLKNLYERAENITGNWSVKNIFTSECGGIIYNSMIIMSLMKKNVTINNIQHSGMLGYHEGGSFFERITLKNFMSWGWESEYKFGIVNPTFISRRPLKTQCQIKPQKDRWLLITNAADYLFDMGFGVDYSCFCDNHFKFVDALSVDSRKKIVVRLEMYELMNPIKYQYATKYRNIRIEERNAVPFAEAVESSELVICDIVSSSHLEALSLDRPVVFFDGCKSIIKNNYIEKKLNKLKECRVFFDNPQELAEYVSEISDIGVWWESKERKQAIKEYLNVAANDIDGSAKLWNRYINQEKV